MRKRARVVVASVVLAGGVALVGGTGCKVDQEKEVASYRKELAIPATSPASDPDAFAKGAPLTLQQAMLLANRHNERLAIEGENYVQALVAKKRAAAAFLPVIALQPSYQLRDTGSTGHNVGGFAKSQTNVAVTGDVNVFNGFSDVANLEAADLTIEQRRALLLDLQESVLLDVARTYYQVMKAERSVEVLTNSLAVQEARVRDIQGRRAAGFARPLDVAQTEAQASGTRVTLIAAQNDVTNGRTTLALLTGAPVEHSTLIDRYPDPVASALGEETLLRVATDRRHDLRAADAAAQAARRSVDAAMGQYYPSVGLNSDVFLASSPHTASDFDALVAVRFPIFSAGLIEADVRDAWSRFRQAVLFRSYLSRQIDQEVRVAYQNLAASNRRISELQTQLTAADAAFRAADQSYNIGNATNLERVVAQDQLLNAQLQLAAERFDNKVFFLDLLRATGDLRERLEGGVAGAATMPSTQAVVSVGKD